MKKFFIISILAIGCVNNLYAAGNCGFSSLDTSIAGTVYGYAPLNGNAGSNESNYGLTTGSGQWATEFSYGTVWGMANCNDTDGPYEVAGTPTLASSGKQCWCQATGFTASGNSYTSGPKCTTSASSLWVFEGTFGSSDSCAGAGGCVMYCAHSAKYTAAYRAALYGAVPVGLSWYDNGTAMSGGPSSCTIGGTFVPPTPPARTGYVFAGWKSHAGECDIWKLDTNIKGSAYGYARLNGNAGSNESKYGLTRGSGQWAAQFSYGTVWGMAKCSTTSGNHSSFTWPESSKSDWLKTPSNTTGQYCWCQATGFTATASSYTSGPQCTTAASSLWVFRSDNGSSKGCTTNCAPNCAIYARDTAAFRAGMFGVVGQ